MSDIAIKSRPNKSTLIKTTLGIIALIVAIVVASNSFFYAEPGYIYHVRTVLGDEEVVIEVGLSIWPLQLLEKSNDGSSATRLYWKCD